MLKYIPYRISLNKVIIISNQASVWGVNKSNYISKKKMLCLRKIFVFIPILSNVILFLQAAVCLQVQLHF